MYVYLKWLPVEKLHMDLGSVLASRPPARQIGG